MASDRSLIRVGIVANGTVVPAWQAHLLRRLVACADVQLVVYLSTGLLQMQSKVPWPGSIAVSRYLRTEPYEQLAATKVAQHLNGTVVVELTEPTEQDQALKNAELDVLLLLDNDAARHRCGRARYGSWWYRHPAAPGWNGLPPGLVERISGIPFSHLQLVRGRCGTDNDAEVEVLRTSTFLTHTADRPQRTDALLAHAATWPAELLRKHGTEPPGLAEGSTDRTTMDLDPPGIMNSLSALFRGLGHRPQRAEGQVEWNIGILAQPIKELLEDRPSLNVRWLPAPNTGSHRLEPFGYADRTGELNIIYRKDVPDGPSRFARVRPKADNILKRSRELLQLGSSLSYPYVVEHADEVFVVVSRQAEQVTELHRVDDNNAGLAPVRTLLSEALTAPTLFHIEGRWWLMGTKPPLVDEALYLYSADQLEGPYQSHPMNPVRIDARGARPAGTPFVHHGILWRPGLDTTDPAHYRVVLNEVLKFDPSAFLERSGNVIGAFKGSVYPEGIRTVCAAGEITLVDGSRSLTDEQVAASGRRRKQRRKERSKKP